MTLLQLLSPTTLDRQVWLLETIAQLRAKDFDRVNWEFLLEEAASPFAPQDVLNSEFIFDLINQK